MPDSPTYLPNGLRVGSSLEVDTDAPAELQGGLIVSTSLVVNTDAPAQINDGLIVGTSLEVNTTAPAAINDGLIVDTSMAVDAGEMSIGENAELTIGHDGTDGFIKTDNVAPSDFHIATGALKTMVLDEAIYGELPPVPVVGAKLGSTAPTLATFVDDIEQYTFDNSNDFIIGATELTHRYKEGTDLFPHVHWATNGVDGTDRTVKWQMKYTISNGDGSAPFVSSFGSQVAISEEVIIPATTADRAHILTGLGTIDGTGLKIGAYVLWRLERIASTGDEPSSDPFGLNVGFHHIMDTIGSRQPFIK